MAEFVLSHYIVELGRFPSVTDSRTSKSIRLQPRELAVIKTLVQAEGRPVSEDQLGPGGLKMSVRRIRRALGDGIVVAVRGYGYRLGYRPRRLAGGA